MINIIKKTTPHQSSRGDWTPDMICCHQTGGGIQSAINWFADPSSNVSSHFAVSKTGEIYQFVDIAKMAWCNGTNTTDSTASNYYLKSPNALIKSRKANANRYTVSIEFENADTGILTDRQYNSGLDLMRFVTDEIKRVYGHDFTADREHIIGHYECSPVNKAGCPGRDFPYERFIGDLAINIDDIALGKIRQSKIKIPNPATYDNTKPFYHSFLKRLTKKH